MTRLTIGLALAFALAGCNTTSDPAALEPAAGTAPATAEATPAAAGAAEQVADGEVATTEPAEVADSAPAPVEETQAATQAAVDTSAVDQAAQAYLNCVVGRAAQSAEGGTAAADAVELGIDACRNQFREARWAYKDTGVTDDAADRYGANLLAFVRNEALTFLQTPAQ